MQYKESRKYRTRTLLNVQNMEDVKQFIYLESQIPSDGRRKITRKNLYASTRI